MYNALISTAASLVLFMVLYLAAHLPWWLSLAVSLLVFMGSFFLISRFIMKKVMAVMESAAKDFQGQRLENGIAKLKGALPFGKWQMYVTGQINAQIGMVYYMKRDFSNAFSYLEKGFFKNWVAMGMLAITYMKRNKKERMIATFDKTLVWSGKEPLLWNLYAYCLTECGETTKAKEVLERGLKKVPGDEQLKINLTLLGEGKKMKMRSYGEMWFQFHLESLGTIQKHQAAALGGKARRRVVR